MEDWVELFKNNPLGATLGTLGAAFWFWWKTRQEKQTDNREVSRLTEALIHERAARIEAEEARDAAVAKQIEQVERFSEMRAQNERLLERMGMLTEQMRTVVEENARLHTTVEQLRQEVAQSRAEVQQLRQSVKS